MIEMGARVVAKLQRNVRRCPERQRREFFVLHVAAAVSS